MKFNKIYVDLDGVLFDISKRWVELYGFPIESNEKHHRQQFTKNFGHFIETNQFSNLELMHDALDLIHFLKHQPLPVEILGSTGWLATHRRVVDQKEICLQTHGIIFPRNFVPGKEHKKVFAAPYNILIDDTLPNIVDWNENGGAAVHHKDAKSTIQAVQNLLKL